MNSAKVNDSTRCDVCSQIFKRRQELLKHQRIVHNMDTIKEKHQAKIAASKSPIPFQFGHTPRTTPEFVCSHCDRPFLSKLCRDKHEINHIATKKFNCRTCDKGFCKAANRKLHEVMCKQTGTPPPQPHQQIGGGIDGDGELVEIESALNRIARAYRLDFDSNQLDLLKR